jgi:hypothetical protein
MNATEEHNFRLRLADMTTSDIIKATDSGQYQEPYLSIAKNELTARASKGSESRDRSRVFLQALQLIVALIALIIAVLAYIKP